MDDWIEPLLLSLKIAGAATLGALPFALLIGRLLARPRFRGKALIEAVFQLPLVLPPTAVGLGLLILLSPARPLGQALNRCCGVELAFTWKAAAIASALMALPLMIVPIRQAFAAIDPGLAEAARVLRAGPLRIWWRITLPLAFPGIVAGVVLGFARALGEFGATITFAGAIPGQSLTLPLAIHQALQSPGGEPAALRLGLVSLAIGFAALLAANRIGRR